MATFEKFDLSEYFSERLWRIAHPQKKEVRRIGVPVNPPPMYPERPDQFALGTCRFHTSRNWWEQ